MRVLTVTQAVHRYAKANNMEAKFNPKEESSYLLYLDANNLYGWAMSQLLPAGGFNWIDPSQFTPDNINFYVECENEGYLLEADVRYPKELHDLHNDLPFMCEKMKINGVEKLVPNLNDKRNYVAHIKALNQVLKHRLIPDKVHRVIEFKQSAWLKPYMDFNTQLRTQAKNDFEKDFFKLMNNSVFSKTMENITKHKDIKLVTNKESFLKTVMKPNFKSGICFSENLTGCEMGKIKFVMNKPIYLGQAIVDLSKLVTYEFYYNYTIPKYGKNLKLCHVDTDSLVYLIKTEDFYADIAGDVKERFDTSGYDKTDSTPLPIGLNKKVIIFH